MEDKTPHILLTPIIGQRQARYMRTGSG